MCYFPGGKKRIGKEIATAIFNSTLEESEFTPKGYTEPFLGMASVYQYIPELFNEYELEYLGGDRNPYIIKLWQKLQTGWKPPKSWSREEYYNYKDKNSVSAKALFCGFACAYRGDFRSSYFAKNNVERQAHDCQVTAKRIKNVTLSTGDYTQFSDCYQNIIYCDPPYRDTQNPYKINEIKNKEFDYDSFIEWCVRMSEDNIIFISEYTKPCPQAELILNLGKEKLFKI